MVKTLWASRRDMEVACSRIDTIWRCMVEPAIRDGFLKRESPLCVTDKGHELLTGEVIEVINTFLEKQEVKRARHPSLEILNHNYVSHCLMKLAAEKQVQEGIIFAVAETYIEERLRSMPPPKGLLCRIVHGLGGKK